MLPLEDRALLDLKFMLPIRTFGKMLLDLLSWPAPNIKIDMEGNVNIRISYFFVFKK
jgi:hypothetical protein